MEQYALNVKFNDEEKLKWIKWAKHEAKFVMVGGIVYILLVLILLASYSFLLIGKTGIYYDITNSYFYYFTSGIIEKLAYIILFMVMGFFTLLSRIAMKKPDILKKISITVNSENCKIDVKVYLYKSKKVILNTSYTIYDFLQYVCNVKENELYINSEIYKIGSNADIYTKEERKYYKFAFSPETKTLDVNNVSMLVKNMKGVDLSFESIEKSNDWENFNKQ